MLPEALNRPSVSRDHPALEAALVVVCAVVLMAVVSYPWVFRMRSAARIDSVDGQFAVWNVSWVARTLVVDPAHLLDANIFYPHRGTLAYSEMNIGAGLLALPVYWLTGNPVFAHNSAVLLAFIFSAAAAYYLGRYLTGDRWAASVAAICFAFSPFVFARTPQVQLMMTFGAPLTMLALHRMADRPTIPRGAAVGASVALQTLFCAYYGVFGVVLVGFGVAVLAIGRERWKSASYWAAVAASAVTAAVLILPLFLPFRQLQSTTGFGRGLAEARMWSSDWRSYLASSARAHAWLLRLIGRWKDVDFPGFVAVVFAAASVPLLWRSRDRQRELVALYLAIAFFFFWTSFGPNAGLYTVLYHAVPVFSFMRAPSRFALLVELAVAILAAFGVQQWRARSRHPVAVGATVVVLAVAELIVPLRFLRAPAPDPAYLALAAQQSGPLVELPIYTGGEIVKNTRYMFNSTAHWMPLVNGFSDYTPPDFLERAATLRSFPSPQAFALLQREGVRYAMVHLSFYDAGERAGIEQRLAGSEPYLRLIAVGADTRLFVVTGAPPADPSR